MVNPKIIANGLGKQIRLAKYLTENKNVVDSPFSTEKDTQKNQLETLDSDTSTSTSDSIRVAFIETKQNNAGRLVRGEVSNRVNTGLENLLAFQGSENVLEIYGYCNEEIEQIANKKGDLEKADRTIFISEFCQNGDLATFIGTDTYKNFDMIQRVKLIISFLNTFKFLHNSPSGKRINCDMNGLHRALTQFLVTDDYRVVLNDLDDIPLADKTNRCEWGLSNIMERHSDLVKNETIEIEKSIYMNLDQLLGGKWNAFLENFLAPEQVMSDNQFYDFYPEEKQRFDTEKIDIWKIPDMVVFVLTKTVPTFSDSLQATQVLFTVEEVLRRCKEIDYKKRPDASEIINSFEKALEALEIKRLKDSNDQLSIELDRSYPINSNDDTINDKRLLLPVINKIMGNKFD